jgi:hypothetical protein
VSILLLSRRSFATVFLLTIALSQPAMGQTSAAHKDVERVRAYAPIVWLATNEPFFPTLPHPYAFDGLDNDNNGKVDLADPEEISLAIRLGQKNQRLVDLENNFRRIDPTTNERRRVPEPRILYRAPKPFRQGDDKLEVIQFWLYYVADVGTGSHEGDSEHAFLFIDQTGSGASTTRRLRTSGAVRAVVGAGHTGDTANNILATGSLESPTGVMPATLPRHMPLLVELGKHATTPDLTMDGRFNSGIDSNVFRQASWGSRDAFSFDVLELFAGYREEYSLPRNSKDILLERTALTEARLAEYRQDFPEHFSDPAALRQNLTYRLFPVEDLEHVFQILRKANGYKDEKSRAELGAFLRDHAECFWHPADSSGPSTIPSSFELNEEQFDAFLRWLDVTDEHARVWEKRDFLNPGDIFKTYLFPRLELGIGTTWAQDKPAGNLLGAMLRVAEFSVARRPLLNDSSLELYANFQTKPLALYDFGLTYRYFRGGFGGPYFGIGWRGEDRRGSDELAPGELARLVRDFGEAAATVPTRYERHTGIDLGYAIAWNLGRLPKGRTVRRLTLGATIGLRSELFAENLPPIEEAINPDLPRRTRFQAKVTLHVGVVPPKHPLQR